MFRSCLNKNIVLFTSIFLKQTSLLRANEVFNQSCMANSTSAKLWFSKFGDPNKVVELLEEPIPSPKASEVLVKMVMSPVNPADMNLIQGVYPVKPVLPAVPGIEGVGVVEEVGSGVEDLSPGDRIVINGEALGTWRTYGVYPADKVMKVNDDVDFVELAGLTSNPSTAYRMLKDFVNLKPGDTIIQNGANSAAGQNVIQLCKIWGINSINVVRTRPEIDSLKGYLYGLGATHVLTSQEIRFFDLKTLPKPILALNCVGGSMALDILSYVANNGIMVTYGGMSREPVSATTSALVFKNIKFAGFWMTRWYREHRGKEEHQTMINDLTSYMSNGTLKAPHHQLVSLKDYRIAIMSTLNRQGYTGRKFILDMREQSS